MRRVQVPISKHSQTAILWTYQSPSKKTPPLQIPPHMGKRYAIWRRSRIGNALVWVGQPICSERLAMEANLFHRSGLKHYSTIRLLTLRVNLMEYDEEHWSWSTCREQRLFAVLGRRSFLSNTLRQKNAPLLILAFFVLFSSTKSVPMCLVTCWKYKPSLIFISSRRNEPKL